jgi:CRP-like cAMP-binding protein
MSEAHIDAESLQRIPFFGGLSPDDAESVLRVGRRISFQPGDTIVERGELGDGMYLILAGTAEVDVGGRFHTLKQGDFFGEMALITARNRMATVKAVEPVQALMIPAEDFQAFLLSHPTVPVAMLKALVERLREVEERVDAWMGSG